MEHLIPNTTAVIDSGRVVSADCRHLQQILACLMGETFIGHHFTYQYESNLEFGDSRLRTYTNAKKNTSYAWRHGSITLSTRFTPCFVNDQMLTMHWFSTGLFLRPGSAVRSVNVRHNGWGYELDLGFSDGRVFSIRPDCTDLQTNEYGVHLEDWQLMHLPLNLALMAGPGHAFRTETACSPQK